MKKIKIYVSALLCTSLLMSGCNETSNATKGGVAGGAGGALIGGIIGNLIGKDTKGTVIGAAIGAAVGTGAGVIIGKKMDKQKAELEQINGAQVENTTDSNGLQAIKVTFDSGILFATNKSELNTAARNSLQNFAASLQNNPLTNVLIFGHTDNTGSRQVNEKLSLERAQAVANNLMSHGVNGQRLAMKGLAYDDPIADNSTVEGRAKNRRVEVYIVANNEMINQAQSGTLQ
ncbi:MAG: OmpA family protein [Prevotellaceae bacterium]|jgi:outer membrane protein OmpA-like peptidoglycan-associated protein|nr:OmpA family protein [Prevotellaceae bacterium]